MRSIEELERGLQGPESGELSAPLDLAGIRRAGLRRRRGHRVLTGSAGVMAGLALVGGVYAVTDGGPRSGSLDGSVASDPQPSPTPTALSPLAERVLREIPGAVQVSAWQVVIPAPAAEESMGISKLEDSQLMGAQVVLPAHVYTGVTDYEASAFPAWLHSGVEEVERGMGSEEDGYPVGSTAMGILVDQGPATLGCTRWPDDQTARPGCTPSFLSELNGSFVYQWGMGTEDFLEPDAGMEVFLSPDYSAGHPGTLAIAGLDGTDVARAEFISADGTRTPGVVAVGTVVPDESMFFANVPGTLARVVAYDADGGVIENHRLRDCTSAVDCEVR